MCRNSGTEFSCAVSLSLSISFCFNGPAGLLFWAPKCKSQDEAKTPPRNERQGRVVDVGRGEVRLARRIPVLRKPIGMKGAQSVLNPVRKHSEYVKGNKMNFCCTSKLTRDVIRSLAVIGASVGLLAGCIESQRSRRISPFPCNSANLTGSMSRHQWPRAVRWKPT